MGYCSWPHSHRPKAPFWEASPDYSPQVGIAIGIWCSAAPCPQTRAMAASFSFLLRYFTGLDPGHRAALQHTRDGGRHGTASLVLNGTDEKVPDLIFPGTGRRAETIH